MTIGLENATIYIAIITFAVWIAKCLIVSPLKESISGLQRAIEKLEKSLAILDEKMDSQRERIALVEASTRSAHKRIDEMAGH
jgi:flagellar biogenesis protein FliO